MAYPTQAGLLCLFCMAAFTLANLVDDAKRCPFSSLCCYSCAPFPQHVGGLKLWFGVLAGGAGPHICVARGRAPGRRRGLEPEASPAALDKREGALWVLRLPLCLHEPVLTEGTQGNGVDTMLACSATGQGMRLWWDNGNDIKPLADLIFMT